MGEKTFYYLYTERGGKSNDVELQRRHPRLLLGIMVIRRTTCSWEELPEELLDRDTITYR